MVKRTATAVTSPTATAPAQADVAAVVNATAAMTPPTDTTEEAVLLEAKAGFVLPFVGSDALATTLPIDPADTARELAQAQSDELNAQEPEREAPPFVESFPCVVMLLNHSGIAITERITGAFVPAGGSAPITLHDEAHASLVAESLQKLVEENFLSPRAIVVQLT